ncbi:hypothetical protein VCHA39O220_120088 [Vibrio chagasii]|nr:hypothetical protein VCHA39O220_120088 [Vibrio chagasii]CAH7198677.1 hypothetical protein VCHA39O224_150014 [Vibrio chagasii]
MPKNIGNFATKFKIASHNKLKAQGAFYFLLELVYYQAVF